MKNELIYANPQSSLEDKSNFMMTYDDFFVRLNEANVALNSYSHIPEQKTLKLGMGALNTLSFYVYVFSWDLHNIYSSKWQIYQI